MTDGALASRADHRACAELIRGGSRSFFVASLLLPSRLRSAAYAVYGFCRLSDDAVDDLDGPSAEAGCRPCHGKRDARTLMAAKLGAVARLRQRLARIYSGKPEDSAVDRALADVVGQYHVPQSLFLALLEGFEWDARGQRYETLEALEAYAARVAGTVGAIMAVLMGARDPERLARACDLGVAMQLTNIARDIGEDARMGRLYLPLRWMREAGVSPEDFVSAPRCTPALRELTGRLLARADALYGRSDAGIAALPRDCRQAIRTARLLYAEIGHMLRREGCDSISRRTVTGVGTKLSLATQAALPMLRPPVAAAQARRGPLQATRFLVDAVLAHPVPILRADEAPEQPGADGVDDRVGRVFDLLIALHHRELQGHIMFERPRRTVGWLPQA